MPSPYARNFGIKRKNRKDRELRRLRTGSPTQLQQPRQQQQMQRGAYKQPTGRVSTTERPEEEQQGLLASAKEGKAYVDGITGMYDTGKSAGEGIEKGMDWITDKTGFSMPDLDFSMPDFLTGGSSTPTLPSPVPTNFSMVDGVTTSLGGTPVGADSIYAGGNASGLLGDSTGAIDGVDDLATNSTGLQAGATNPLGALTSGLGVGLNVADMANSGVNFGNVTGALGSGILGAGALGLGAANAWNPVGWGLLAASAADQIFDIF